MSIKAPMSGSVWKMLVKVGDKVETGQEVAILESMNMEIPIVAEFSGVVKEVSKNEGDFVQEDESLITLEN